MSDITAGNLIIRLEGDATKATTSVDGLVTSLNNLKGATKGGSFGTLISNINALNDAAGGADGSSKLRNLASAMTEWSKVKKPNITKSHSNAIVAMGDAVKKIPMDVMARLQSLSTGLGGLTDIGKSNLGTMAKHLGMLPEALEKVQKIDLAKVTTQMRELAAAMRPLADEMQKISNGFGAMPKNIQSFMRQMDGATAKVGSKASGGRASTLSNDGIFAWLRGVRWNMVAVAYLSQRITRTLGDMVTESNNYIENLNLFDIAMGEHVNAARNWVEQVQATLGLDSSEVMRNMGIFKAITTGFGVAEDQAQQMSKNLTQLAYDAASAYNITFESAMEKFQAGLAGQVRPLRDIGFALDVATLQQIAYAHGIDQSVKSMSQAEKAELRFIAMMTQQQWIMGDLARTVHTPANAMRILTQQTVQLKRALGNILIPILMKILPYLQAFVELLTRAAQALALMMGFTLPQIDYSGIASGSGVVDDIADGFDDVAGNAGRAADAVKEFRNFLLGFDEMHVIPSNATADSGGGLGGGGTGLGGLGGGLGLDLSEYDYDFLGGISRELRKAREEVDAFFEKVWYILEPLIGLIEGIGVALLITFAADKLGKLLDNVLTFTEPTKEKFKAVGDIVAGIGLAWVATGTLTKQYFSGAIDDTQLIIGLIGTMIGSLYLIQPALMTLSLPGWLGPLIAGGAIILRIIFEFDKLHALENLKRRFGELTLTMEEATELARALTRRPWQIHLQGIAKAREDLEVFTDSIESLERKLRIYELKVNLGVDFGEGEFGTTVTKYIEDSLGAVQSQLDLGLLTFDLFLQDETIKLDAVEALTNFYVGYETQIREVGSVLKTLMYEGWLEADDASERKALVMQQLDVIRQVNEEVRRMTQSGELAAMGYDLSGNLSSLDWDSYRKTLTGMVDFINEDFKEALRGKGQNDHILKIIYKDDPVALSAALRESQINFDNIVLEQQLGVVEVVFTTNEGAFGDVLPDRIALAKSKLPTIFTDSSYTDWTLGDYAHDPLEFFALATGDDYVSALIESMFPKAGSHDIGAAMVGFKEIQSSGFVAMQSNLMDSYMQMGAKIPEALAEGMMQTAALGMLAGSQEQINYILGQQFASSPEYMKTLSEVRIAGAEVPKEVAQGLYSALEVVRDPATGLVTTIRNSITGEIIPNTAILRENLKEMGIDITKMGYAEGILEGASAVTDAVSDVVNSVDETLNGSGLTGGGSRPNARPNSRPAILTEFINSISALYAEVEPVLNENFGWLGTLFNDTTTALGKAGGSGLMSWFGSGVRNNRTEVETANSEVADKIKEALGADVMDLLGGEGGHSLIQGMATTMGTMEKVLITSLDKVNAIISTKMTFNTGVFTTMATDMAAGARGMVGTFQSVTQSLLEPWNIFFAAITSGLGATLSSVAQSISSIRTNVSPTGSIGFSYAAPIVPQVTLFAGGGFPTAGELFAMNETEPEFLTTVGGRTAVVNQEQMADGLYKAVYGAMMDAGGSRDGGDLTINVDGRRVLSGDINDIKRKNQRAGKAVIQVGV